MKAVKLEVVRKQFGMTVGESTVAISEQKMTQNTKAETVISAIFILYVEDQDKSTEFYTKVFKVEPSLYEPGMTEFTLGKGCKLGLMPRKGIKKLLGDSLPNLEEGNGIPSAEVYLIVDDPEEFHKRALAHGARELSPLSKRDWGDIAAYSADLDGHILVFATTGKIN